MPGDGEYGWFDRDLSFEGFKEWARRGFEADKKPTRKEIEERDPKWEHDLNQWMHLLVWTEDTTKIAQQFGAKS
jgi:hypothetical protein